MPASRKPSLPMPADFKQALSAEPAALDALRPDGVLWISYPKAGALGTDLTRDRGFELIQRAGYEGVLQVAVDETWSALRFKPRAAR